MKTYYELLDFDRVQRVAKILGDSSSASQALASVHDRLLEGQIPLCAKATNTRGTAIIVFDAREPMEFLPQNIKADCKKVVEAVNLQRRNTAQP